MSRTVYMVVVDYLANNPICVSWSDGDIIEDIISFARYGVADRDYNVFMKNVRTQQDAIIGMIRR